MQPFWTTRAFRNGIWVLLILTIVFMAKQVEFLFYPIGIFFATVLTPFLFAGILFYLTVGLVDWLELKFKRRSLAILAILLLLLLLTVVFVLTLGPLITRQLLALLDTFPRFAEEIRKLHKHYKWSEVVIIGQDRSANLLKEGLGLDVERVVNRNLRHAEEEEVLRRAFEA